MIYNSLCGTFTVFGWYTWVLWFSLLEKIFMTFKYHHPAGASVIADYFWEIRKFYSDFGLKVHSHQAKANTKVKFSLMFDFFLWFLSIVLWSFSLSHLQCKSRNFSFWVMQPLLVLLSIKWYGHILTFKVTSMLNIQKFSQTQKILNNVQFWLFNLVQ